MRRLSLSVSVFALSLLGLSGQQPDVVQGRVVQVVPRAETNVYGDELIVSTVTLDSGRTIRVVGGTIGGVTLDAAHSPVPAVGRSATFHVDRNDLATEVVIDGYKIQPWTWPASAMPVPYFVNPSTPDLGQPAVLSAMAVGASAWHRPDSIFRWTYGGETTETAVVPNGKSELFFRNASNGTLIAETYKRVSGSTILEADVIFYDATYQFYTGTSGCNHGIYVEDIAAHEFGHGLGLGHSSISAATMYATLGGYCSQKARTLYSDDVAGLLFLYPGESGGVGETYTLNAQNTYFVRLTWSGFSSSSVDVYLDGAKWKTTANDGAQKWELTTAPPHNYHVCEYQSTTACSATITR